MKFPRLFGWLIATLFLMVVIGLFYPQQLPVSLYKLSLVTMAGVIGYWLDRSLFPYARPDAIIEEDMTCDIDLHGDCKTIPWSSLDGLGFIFGVAMLRRAIIVGCAMLAIGLGA